MADDRGEAAWLAADALAESLCTLAGAISDGSGETGSARWDLRAETGDRRMSLAEVAEAGHFRHDLLPPGTQSNLPPRGVPPSAPFCIANGIQGARRIDLDTGIVSCSNTGSWKIVPVINPLLVDEQIRAAWSRDRRGAFRALYLR